MKLKHVAVIEPNQARWKALAASLKKAGLTVTAAREAQALGKEQVVVLGASAKSPSKVAREVREKLPDAILLAAQSKGFKAPFADAVLPLPVSVNDLKVRLAEWAVRSAGDDLPAARPGEGILDPTTNFYTFAHFKEVLFVEVKRARRYGFPLALAVLAFDSQSGAHRPTIMSQLMGGLALAIRRSLRDTDYPVQYSADRVLLLMPHTDLAGSLIVARRICERVSRASLQVDDELIHPTISVGVAAGEPGREYGFSDLVRQAQDGLMQAMARGGNRVEFYDASSDTTLEVPAPPAVPPVSG
ncbi:MAG: GGDEF domain-containing protein [Myxococcaceae bacterium]|nr:GGDEF domain-containing protein [Myxococcaceae bacterium]